MNRTHNLRRAVLVERDEVGRRGRAAVMNLALGDSWTVDTMLPEQVGSSCRSDLVVVVVEADGTGFDRYDVTAAIVKLQSGQAWARPAILAARSGLNPLLDVRLLQAGAQTLIPIDHIARSDDGRILAVFEECLAAGSSERRSARSAAGELADVAKVAGTDPTAVLDYVVSRDLEPVFDPHLAQADLGLSRRAVMRIRRDISALGGIRPSLNRYTGGAERNIELATWREVVAYVNWARGETGWEENLSTNGDRPRIGTLCFNASPALAESARRVA
jgi:hypothetical protein